MSQIRYPYQKSCIHVTSHVPMSHVMYPCLMSCIHFTLRLSGHFILDVMATTFKPISEILCYVKWHVTCHVLCHMSCGMSHVMSNALSLGRINIQKYILEHQNQGSSMLRSWVAPHSDPSPRMLKYPQVCEIMTLQPQAFFKCVAKKWSNRIHYFYINNENPSVHIH